MDEIDKYILENSSLEDELLRELDRETHLRVLNPRMISGHVQGKLLEMFVRMLRPRRVLEIGTFTGYSTLCMAAGMASDGDIECANDGRRGGEGDCDAAKEGRIIDTIEVDDELEAIAASYFARSAHGKYIRQHVGDALDIVPQLDGGFDLVFIDGDKRQYPDYLQVVIPVMRTGGFIVADNVLWYGKVAAPAAAGDLHTARLQEFNRMVVDDPRLENIIIPLRDGLNVIRLKK